MSNRGFGIFFSVIIAIPSFSIVQNHAFPTSRLKRLSQIPYSSRKGSVPEIPKVFSGKSPNFGIPGILGTHSSIHKRSGCVHEYTLRFVKISCRSEMIIKINKHSVTTSFTLAQVLDRVLDQVRDQVNLIFRLYVLTRNLLILNYLFVLLKLH